MLSPAIVTYTDGHRYHVADVVGKVLRLTGSVTAWFVHPDNALLYNPITEVLTLTSLHTDEVSFAPWLDVRAGLESGILTIENEVNV